MRAKAKYLFVLAILFGLLTLVIDLNISSHTSKQEAEFRERAEKYIADLGVIPIEELSTEQKLLLFHAYAITQRPEEALAVYTAVEAQLKQLPPDRQKAFHELAQSLHPQS